MSLLTDIQQWESQGTKTLTQSYLEKGFKASGNWPRELEWINTLTPFRINIKLLGADYTDFMINGRGPTAEGAPAGDPTLQTIIEKWVKDKGVSANPYAITKSIHEHGTQQYRNPDPKKKRLLEDAIPDKSLNELIDIIRKDTIARITINIQKTFT